MTEQAYAQNGTDLMVSLSVNHYVRGERVDKVLDMAMFWKCDGPP